MKWFGDSWGASVCDPALHVSTPMSAKCGKCGRAIELRHQGVILPHITGGMGGGVSGALHDGRGHYGSNVREEPWHLDCLLAELGIAGGLQR